MPKVYFDEAVAKRYDTDFADMFQPEVIDPAVSFLPAGPGTAAPSNSVSAPAPA